MLTVQKIYIYLFVTREFSYAGKRMLLMQIMNKQTVNNTETERQTDRVNPKRDKHTRRHKETNKKEGRA